MPINYVVSMQLTNKSVSRDFTLTGLNGNTEYVVVVHAVTGAGRGEESDRVQFTTPTGPREEHKLVYMCLRLFLYAENCTKIGWGKGGRI